MSITGRLLVLLLLLVYEAVLLQGLDKQSKGIEAVDMIVADKAILSPFAGVRTGIVPDDKYVALPDRMIIQFNGHVEWHQTRNPPVIPTSQEAEHFLAILCQTPGYPGRNFSEHDVFMGDGADSCELQLRLYIDITFSSTCQVQHAERREHGSILL